MKHTKVMKVLAAALLGLALFAFPKVGEAQNGTRVDIPYLSDAQFPQVQAYISVSDAQGLPIKGLTANNLSVSEDGKPVTDFKFTAIQNSAQPLAIALLIDTSGTMGYGTPTPLKKSIEAGKAFIASLAPQDMVALVSFSDAPKVEQDFTTDHTLLNTALDGLKLLKNTAMYDAIVKASTMLSSRGERRIIVLLTDGMDSGTGFSFDQAANEAQKWSIPIYPIGFGGVDKNTLQKLASLTGGSVQVKPDPTTLTGAFAQVLQILREQYLLEYYSALPADGTEHTLAATMDYQGWHQELTHRFLARAGTITVTLPGHNDGDVIFGNVTFAPQWTTPAPGIRQVDFLMDDAALNSLTTAPYEFTWDSTTAGFGVHAFTIRVTDTSGNVGTLNLNLDVEPPITISFVQPVDKATVEKKMPVQVNVTARGTVDRVEFSVDGQAPVSITQAPYDWNWEPASLPAGQHTITAKAYDTAGFTSEANVTVDIALKPSMGILLIAGIPVLLLAAILIPLALRKRKKYGPVEGGAGAAAGQAALTEVEGMNPGKTWVLGQNELRLGRKQDENDIVLKGLKASRRHAVIHPKNGQFEIQCLNPANPLIVNGESKMEHILCKGDTIRLGETLLRFE